jgi:arabinofuranosyltransferase
VLVVGGAARRPPPEGHGWLVVVPPLLLAATRSVAVWSTSGLETRLFEVLVVAGVLRSIQEEESDRAAARPLSGVWLALAALTRPEGLLIAASVLGVRAGRALVARRAVAPVLGPIVVFAVLVGAHFLFRRAYYGEWLPNTYWAKVGGRSWWEMGRAYIAAFVLEYGLLLWVPLWVLGVRRFLRTGAAAVLLAYAAVVIPHALYVASIGGDHFEYRPLDLYFPFLALLAYEGLAAIVPRPRGDAIAGAVATVLLIGLILVPLRSKVQFPSDYRTGFPGQHAETPEGAAFLDPATHAILRLPGLHWSGRAHRDLVRKTTNGLVGVRQEEHVLFAKKVWREAEGLRTLIEVGKIRPDAYLAIDCVGIIPYETDLRVLDRLGLTDAHVARSDTHRGRRIMAHDKRATVGWARERGVDFWAFDPVHSLWDVDERGFHVLVNLAAERGLPAFVADAGDGKWLLGILPSGTRQAAERFPGLVFRPVTDPEVREAIEAAGASRAVADDR